MLGKGEHVSYFEGSWGNYVALKVVS